MLLTPRQAGQSRQSPRPSRSQAQAPIARGDPGAALRSAQRRGAREKINEMRDKLAKKLADPALYEDTRVGELEIWNKKYAEVMEGLDRAEALWMAALEKSREGRDRLSPHPMSLSGGDGARRAVTARQRRVSHRVSRLERSASWPMIPSSSSPLRANAAALPKGTPVLTRRAPAGRRSRFGLRRARHLLEMPDHARPTASSPSTASTVAADALSEWNAVEQRYDEKRGLKTGPPARLPGQRCRAMW